MIGRILKNIRKTRGLTQEYVGKQVKLAENTISNYETEYSNPNFDYIYKIISVCDFDIEFVDKKSNKRYSVEELTKEMDF